MPRRTRMYLPGHVYHVFQRGNNRNSCFLESENYQYYLGLWIECSRRYGVTVHAYCLMTNHVHFLVTPAKTDSISRVTRDVGSRYAFYFNRKYNRTGTLWEGRHKSCLVQDERYFLTCSRYIELNPVEAGIVDQPGKYAWSSYLANAWGRNDWLDRHDVYQLLGENAESRRHAYRDLFKKRLTDEDIHLIEESLHYCQPVAEARFKQQLEQRYGISLGQSARGRPRKREKVVKK